MTFESVMNWYVFTGLLAVFIIVRFLDYLTSSKKKTGTLEVDKLSRDKYQLFSKKKFFLASIIWIGLPLPFLGITGSVVGIYYILPIIFTIYVTLSNRKEHKTARQKQIAFLKELRTLNSDEEIRRHFESIVLKRINNRMFYILFNWIYVDTNDFYVALPALQNRIKILSQQPEHEWFT